MDSEVNILIVDDEPNIRSGLAKGLERQAGRIETASSVNDAIDCFSKHAFELLIVDVRLPGDRNGLELVSWVRQHSPSTLTIVMTAHGTVETAVDAMRRGAFDFITKPVDLVLIREQIAKAAQHQNLQRENHRLRERLASAGEFPGIVGTSRALQDVLEQIKQVATTEATVLIHGESGTGKELIARAVHDLSNRSSGPFVAVNLGALPESLLESELFGHQKGSFTGASRDKPGCFEQAFGGTLFLDEISEIPPKSQVDLLRVLETAQFTRVGGETLQNSDARIVSASNRHLPELVEDGAFREDLYYRLNIVPIELPSLRQRREDIPILVDHFLQHFCGRHQRPLKTIEPAATALLTAANWPGNVRQLRNVVERMVVTISRQEITADDLPTEITQQPRAANAITCSLADAVETAEKTAIQSALANNDFHREQTAKALSISVRTLHYKMSRYNLH